MLTIKELDEALGSEPQTSLKLLEQRSTENKATKAMCDLMQAVEDGKVAVVPTELNIEIEESINSKGCDMNCVCRYAADQVYEESIKAADCELAKILEDV